MAKVLVVDDSAFMRLMIRNQLMELGHEVVEAGTGEAALRLYLENKPDVVTLDMLMPGMQGPEVLERLVALDADAKVIMVTSNVQQFAQKDTLRKGARAFLNKPVKKELLQQVIGDILGEKNDASE